MSADYINSLDIWVVSHGGCGSNYIVDLLEKNGYHLREGGRSSLNYGEHCHRAYIPKGVKTKILYIYGDIIASMCSQQSRRLLTGNLMKLKDGHQNEDLNDPCNYLFQYKNFTEAGAVKLKYPFTEEDIMRTFEELDLTITIMPEVSERTQTYPEKDYHTRILESLKYYQRSLLK